MDIAASPDRLIVDGSGKVISVLEIKCPYARYPIEAKPYAISVQKENPQIIPDHYLQIQCQLACTKATLAFYVVWTITQTLVLEVSFDKDFWDSLILPYCNNYIKNLEEISTLPEEVTLKEVNKLIDESLGNLESMKDFVLKKK